MQDTDIAEATRLLRFIAHDSREATSEMRLAARAWLKRQVIAQRIANPEHVLFDPAGAQHFVWIGSPDRPQLVQHPGLAGILDAHALLMPGPIAAAVYHSDDFARTPGALRERLDAAAEWAGNQGADALARCIRAISISKVGAIRFEQPPGVHLVLSLPDKLAA